MRVYHVWLQTGPRLFRTMYMSVDQVNEIDCQTLGRGLPKEAFITVTMDNGIRIGCMDILVEYFIPMGE